MRKERPSAVTSLAVGAKPMVAVDISISMRSPVTAYVPTSISVMPFGCASTSSTWPGLGTRRYPVSACNGLPSTAALVFCAYAKNGFPTWEKTTSSEYSKGSIVGYLPWPRPVQVPSSGASAWTSGCSSADMKARLPARVRLARPSGRRRYFAVFAQCLDFVLEILRGFERAVHRGEPQVRDFVEVAQRPENSQPYLVARDLRRARRAHGVFHLLGQQIQRIVIDLAPLARPADPADDLFSAEWLGDTAALDHGQDCGFHGGEAPATLGARSATPDGLAFIGFPRVDHPGVRMAAEGAVRCRSFAVPNRVLQHCERTWMLSCTANGTAEYAR